MSVSNLIIKPDQPGLIVFGGGGHGKTLIDVMRARGGYNIVGIIDDSLPEGSQVLGIPVLGGTENLNEIYQKGVHQAVNGVGGIGNPASRSHIFELLAEVGFEFPTIVHPSAVIEPGAILAAGVQIMALCYVSSTSTIGFGSVLNTNAVLSHDCVLGEVVNLSPGATLAGGVIVEDLVQIGMNATINLNLRIGRGARIGNGATVKADVPAGTVVRAGTIWPLYEKDSS